MNRFTDFKTIRRNIPAGFEMPARFHDFIHLVIKKEPEIYGFFDITWTNPEDLELNQEASKTLIPFLRFKDGGIAAFWLNTSNSNPIIYMSSEGESRVSASSFDEFIVRVELHKTGIGDIDESQGIMEFGPHQSNKVELTELGLLDKKFKSWRKKHSALQQPQHSDRTEEIRQRLFAIAGKMIGDGLSKVYTLDSVWWSMKYRFINKKGTFEASYLDYGEWLAVPGEYRLEEEVLKLLPLTKSKKLESFELSIASAGIVSVNDDRELVLVPPE